MCCVRWIAAEAANGLDQGGDDKYRDRIRDKGSMDGEMHHTVLALRVSIMQGLSAARVCSSVGSRYQANLRFRFRIDSCPRRVIPGPIRRSTMPTVPIATPTRLSATIPSAFGNVPP